MIHDINPIFISLGSFHIYWYGIMYLLAFSLAWCVGNFYIKKNIVKISKDNFSDLMFYSFLGVLAGGRIGYSIFYNFYYTLDNPITIFYLWNGGMSFHGGFIGVMVGIIYFCKKNQIPFFEISDFIVKLVPIGLFTGRIGNFINGELWGKPTDLVWGVIFPKIDNLTRHPTQIYEAFLEGIVLFVILNFSLPKNTRTSRVTAYFLIFYSLFRFIVEFFREPDAHIGYLVFSWVTMGQILCAPMFLLGIYILKYGRGK
ncbi:MAG: prolipoprotein diacylglyceryl transferase [Gammaproteobacteria bacterium]|jgi:phosphatidylglycerol---prolipoprotein diacylglyceryl transferase|nr:prolipoprotein diacylglyceryl transferase [Gammaproteobacteria bacterium]